MSDPKKAIELEARITAIEFLLGQLYANLPFDLDQAERALAPILRNATFPTAGPAMSDHASAEIEAAVTELLSQIRLMRGNLRRGTPN